VFGWVVHCFENFIVFRGRAGRPEYWFFVLFLTIVGLTLNVLAIFLPSAFVLYGIWSLVVVMPHYAVATRRLHDSGHTGWWLVPPLLIALPLAIARAAHPEELRSGDALSVLLSVGFLGLLAFAIWIFSLMVKNGDPGPNRYGDPPPTTPS
jgi:uncharacterized membrane protein YhaH (DUF805 family)